MALHISDDMLAEIRNAADIVEMISARVYLKKAGKDFVGLCPFHSEKTPSFTVSQGKQIFYCFGCGAGGNIFNFLMRYDGVSFPEAVQAVARQYGISLPEKNMSPEQKKQASEREHLLALNHRVMQFYKNILLKDSRGQGARQYLKQRGMDRQIIERFNLGYVPEGWDNLIRFLRKSRVSMEMAEKAGLIAPKKQKGYYDRFRNRIIFPIVDISGQVIAFGGRVMDDSKPKYLNSPETPVYHKGRTLYGIHEAREQCRSRGCVFIVEGYFDLLVMHQHGLKNTVATLGTALTRDHIRRLSRAAGSGDKKAYLVFDSDEAGINAAKRTIGAFLEESMEAAVVLLPEGHDPDSYLFEHGPEAFDRLAQGAPSLFEFLIENTIAAHGKSVEGKVRVMGEIAPVLAEISDPVARSLYTRHLTESLGVDESAVLEKVRETRDKPSARSKRPGESKLSEGKGPEKGPAAREPLQDRLEVQVVAMMIQNPESIAEVEERNILDYFEDPGLQALGKLVSRQLKQEQAGVSGMLNHVEDEQQRRLLASFMMEDACWGRESCALLLSQFVQCKQRRKNDLLEQIRAAEQSNDNELLTKLLSKKQKQADGRR
ncbi:MAG: DNA primase [Desulfobacteraceae bacterium]|nr:DNA primase [Desulfobacteraceae bacterium]